ncbi:hypothetical protein D9M68_564040 [compost metagenome]
MSPTLAAQPVRIPPDRRRTELRRISRGHKGDTRDDHFRCRSQARSQARSKISADRVCRACHAGRAPHGRHHPAAQRGSRAGSGPAWAGRFRVLVGSTTPRRKRVLRTRRRGRLALAQLGRDVAASAVRRRAPAGAWPGPGTSADAAVRQFDRAGGGAAGGGVCGRADRAGFPGVLAAQQGLRATEGRGRIGAAGGTVRAGRCGVRAGGGCAGHARSPGHCGGQDRSRPSVLGLAGRRRTDGGAQRRSARGPRRGAR